MSPPVPIIRPTMIKNHELPRSTLYLFSNTSVQAPTITSATPLNWNIINNYWIKVNKIWWFVSVSQINYCSTPSNNCLLYHSITKFVVNSNLYHSLTAQGKRSAIFPTSYTHEQNKICSKTHLDGTTNEQIIICWQLFAGHAVGSRLMNRKGKWV